MTAGAVAWVVMRLAGSRQAGGRQADGA
jgi:hypothetical protein